MKRITLYSFLFLMVFGMFGSFSLRAQVYMHENSDGSVTYILYRHLELYSPEQKDKINHMPMLCSPTSDLNWIEEHAPGGTITVEVKTNFNVIDNKKITENYTLLKFDSKNKDYRSSGNVFGLDVGLRTKLDGTEFGSIPDPVLDKLYEQATLDTRQHYNLGYGDKIVRGIPVAIHVTLPAGATMVVNGERVELPKFQYYKMIMGVYVPHMLSALGPRDFGEPISIKYAGLKRVKMMETLLSDKVVETLEADKEKAPSPEDKNEIEKLMAKYDKGIIRFGFPNSKIIGMRSSPWFLDLQNRPFRNGEFLVPFPVSDESLSFPSTFMAIFSNDNPLYVFATSVEMVRSHLTPVNEAMQYDITSEGGGFAFSNEQGDKYYMYKISWQVGTGQGMDRVKIRIRGKVTTAGPFPFAHNFDPSPHQPPNTKIHEVVRGPTESKPAIICAHRGTFRTTDHVPENCPWAWEKAIYDSWHNIDGTPRYLQARRRNGDPKVDAQGNPVWEQAVMVGGKTLRFDKDGNPVYKHDTYLDMMELDIRSTDKDGVLLVTHDDNPYRELEITHHGMPVLTLRDGPDLIKSSQVKFEQWFYEGESETGDWYWKDPVDPKPGLSYVEGVEIKPLKEVRMRDFFGNPVDYTHILTFKDALLYFKCRQKYGACKCLAETGYLGVMGAQLLQQEKVYAEDYSEVFQGTLEDKKWVMENDQPFSVLLALDKVMGTNNFDNSRLLNAFEVSVETGMEDFVIYKGTFHPKSSESRNLPVYENKDDIEHDIRAQVFSQIRYIPIFFGTPNRKGGNYDVQDMNDFIAKTKLTDPFRKWHVVCCEPHVKMPKTLLGFYNGKHRNELVNRNAAIKTGGILAEVTEIARKNNIWVGVHSGTPLAPDFMSLKPVGDFCTLEHKGLLNCSNLDWRSTPEFCWSSYNNYYMTDSPNLMYHFLEAQEPIPYPEAIPPNTYDNMRISTNQNLISAKFIYRKQTYPYYNSYKFAKSKFKNNVFGLSRKVNKKFSNRFESEVSMTLKVGEGFEVQFSEDQLSTLSGTALANSTYLFAMKKGQSLEVDNFFGFKQGDHSGNFCLSLWIKYDENNKTFDIFNATDDSGDLIYALKSVNGNLVWTRNTSMCSPAIENYDYVLKQGCTFDQGNGWYFLCVNMGSSFCRVGLGKPRPMDYISDVFNADYFTGELYKENHSDLLKSMTIAYCWLGSATQHFEKITKSYIGDPEGINNPPTQISEFRVYCGPTTLHNMYRLFSFSKDRYFDTGN